MMTDDGERLRARANKQEVIDAPLAAETEPHRWRRTLAEKVDTIVKMRGLTQRDAEHEALEHVVVEYSNATHPDTDTTRCGHCGGPETPDATLPFGVGERHTSLHQRCWVPWRERRWTEAIAALAAMGITEPARRPSSLCRNRSTPTR